LPPTTRVYSPHTKALALPPTAKARGLRPRLKARHRDLTGAGLAQIGAGGRLTAVTRRVGQQWSHAIWRHPAAVDGILYRVRHDPRRSSPLPCLISQGVCVLPMNTPQELGAVFNLCLSMQKCQCPLLFSDGKKPASVT
jgi:hypothetical protein